MQSHNDVHSLLYNQYQSNQFTKTTLMYIQEIQERNLFNYNRDDQVPSSIDHCQQRSSTMGIHHHQVYGCAITKYGGRPPSTSTKYHEGWGHGHPPHPPPSTKQATTQNNPTCLTLYNKIHDQRPYNMYHRHGQPPEQINFNSSRDNLYFLLVN
ncbi:hypothetical protein DFA_10274 [Cavenderia fasciculata]|uniref:Uncharacterized protein n=1 Tax=Cavenderia fasciculata TaxID=261658 RepID=F4Q9S0_CACFS|nr:uncharacterized protein DFA_10274 [Cavenderia fasciculata]EGG15439.1 hypothetical protein DFA_10274 [Cavenderia fasciculata]|eukprot:XP_004354181.1 hypothetical protein DFA_10274 [Cavenderia fasciculata]